MIAYNLNTIKSDQIYILTQNTIKEKSDRSKKKKKKKKKKKNFCQMGVLWMIIYDCSPSSHIFIITFDCTTYTTSLSISHPHNLLFGGLMYCLYLTVIMV
jgi:hypothetical protein